jgi:hypothetical protein
VKYLSAGVVAPVLVGLAAAVLLFWGLDERYLWQDEANTAVLATRMLRYGKPLAYDGVNLVGLDDALMEMKEPIDLRTKSPREVVNYYVRQGYLKPDTTWKWHPWGSFAVAAVSIQLLGRTTLAARLPFALAGIATVLLLDRLALVCCASRRIAAMAAALLLCNAYWILHDRQCRYYALSSLFLVLTMLSYERWQRGARWGSALFIAAAWCWFQVDYGTVWPALAVLFCWSLASHWRTARSTLVTGALLAAAIAPFIWYYELWGRRGVEHNTWIDRFRFAAFNINEYVAPAVVIAAALTLLLWPRKEHAPSERRLVAASCGILLALALWVPSMTPGWFLRYEIMAAPLGCFLSAWVLVRAIPAGWGELVWPAAALLAVTPWVSLPLRPLIGQPEWYEGDWRFRPELWRLRGEVFGHPQDINRTVVEWLKKNAAPTDEILVNYEDAPLMYYLPNPVRGGVSAFRVEDDSRSRPRFLVMRPDIDFTDVPAFEREAARYRWQVVKIGATAVLWGNNPDPMGDDSDDPDDEPMTILRRVDN